MKINFFISLILLTRISSIAQTISTKVVADSKTKLPIEFVNIYSDNKKVNVLSTLKGKFTISSDLNVKSYIFNKTGYLIKSIIYEDLVKLDTVFLFEKPVQLNEIDITVKKLEEVVKDKRFYVDDYLVLPNYDFLILTYKINIKGFEVSYYKKDKGITCTKKFKNEYNQHLFKDCFDNYHLVTNACSRQFYFTNDTSFDFLPPFRKSYFDSTLSKVILRLDSQFIYKTENPPSTHKGTYFNTTFHSPYLTYISLFRKKISELYTVVYNKEMREMIQSELGDSRRNQQILEDGKMNANSYSQSSQSREASNSFFIETAIGPIYAPIYNKNDTLIILNFQEDRIVFLDKSGVLLKMINIENFPRYHQFQAYYDEKAQKFYVTVQDNNSHYIKRLNVYTGKFDRTEQLERPFPKNIQIINNRMYFQVKEHEWDDTSYIYLQNL